jgi:hypothetical protein
VNATTTRVVREATSDHVFGSVTMRLLALEIGDKGTESYHVSFKPNPKLEFRSGRMTRGQGETWDIVEAPSGFCINVAIGSPDDVFALALGSSAAMQLEIESKVKQGVPLWPTRITQRLARRRLSGSGVIAFDAKWFSETLATSAMDRPMLFPNATSKLGLADLERASDLLRRIDPILPSSLLAALGTEATTAGDFDWEGEGRLIGEYVNGELGQIGNDLSGGCRAALGTGPLHVLFKSSEPLGIGLGPLQFSDDNPASVGWGAEVGEIETHGAAARAGVLPGMALSHLLNPDLPLAAQGDDRISFESVLEEIDERREAQLDLSITFCTAASVTHLYAVELPAAAALEAFALSLGVAPPTKRIDVGVGATVENCAPLWREETPRLFLGEPGSLTCAHTDICPQLELAHGLMGLKLLGVASHDGTPRLIAEHGENEDEEATRVPTDRALTRRQSSLIGDVDVSLALLCEGDLAVFDSGALHFASNGGAGFCGAIYHGMITAAAVPRLRTAAAKDAGDSSVATAGYQDHLFAADLLNIVEDQMRPGAAGDLNPRNTCPPHRPCRQLPWKPNLGDCP